MPLFYIFDTIRRVGENDQGLPKNATFNHFDTFLKSKKKKKKILRFWKTPLYSISNTFHGLAFLLIST